MPSLRTSPLLPLQEAAAQPLGQAAHCYAEAGVAVFPLVPGTKRPAVEHGFYEASTAHGQIQRWWSWLPEANIGLATGDQVDVLDIDVRASSTGFDQLRDLLDAGLASQWAHAVRTPSGGLHLYYPSDPQRLQRNWSRNEAHIDFRGTGGYIVAAPSRLTVAGRLREYVPVGASYPGRPLAADQIRELLTPARPVIPQHRQPEESLHGYGSRIGGWLGRYEGSDRSGALFWSACRLVEAGAEEFDTYAHLAEPAAKLGLTDRELTATIRRAHQAATPDLNLGTTYRSVASIAQAGGRSLR